MGVVRNILVRVGGDTRQLENAMRNARNAMRNFQRNSNRSMGNARASMRNSTAGLTSSAGLIQSSFSGMAVAAGAAALAVGAAFVAISGAGVKSAIEYEAAQQQLSRFFGESTQGFLNWANTQALAFNMSKKSAVQYGAVYGNLISGIAADQKEAMGLTQSLLKASAVTASATGRDMQDVMERIRSGLLGNTESIEDLGINVNVAMLEATAAFQKFANGKTWDQLDFRTQQQIRLMAILEQSSQKYGNTVANNTSSSLQQLSAIMDNVVLTLGQAFLPLVQAVIPVLIQAANALQVVVSAFSQFMSLLYGTNQEQKQIASTASSAVKAQNNLGNATKKAGSKAKGALASFDEINQLMENMGDNSDAAATSMGSLGVPDLGSGAKVDIVPEWMKTLVSDIKESLTPAINTLSGAWDNLKVAFANISPYLKPIAQGLAEIFKNFIIGNIQGVIYTISGVLTTLAGAFTFLKGVITGDFKTAWDGLKQMFDGVLQVLEGIIVQYGNVLFPGLDKKLNELRANAGNVFTDIGQYIQDKVFPKLSEMWNTLVNIGTEIGTNIVNKIKIFKPVFDTMWNIGLIVMNTAWNLFKNFVIILGTNLKVAIDAVKSVWDKLVSAFSDFLNSTQLKIFFEGLAKLYDATLRPGVYALRSAFNYLWTEFKERLQPASDKISAVYTSISEIIKKLSDYIKNTVIQVFKDFVNKGVTLVNTAIDLFFTNLKNIVATIGVLAKDAAKLFKEDLPKFIKPTVDAFVSLASDVSKMFKDTINNMIDMANFFVGYWNNIKLSVPELEIPGIGKIGGFELRVPQVPKIPKLAEGGLTTRPTLAMIGDNPSGREAVLPLDNTSVMDSLGSTIASAVLGAMQFNNQSSGHASNEVVISIDGTKLARVLVPKITKENNRIGNTVLNLV